MSALPAHAIRRNATNAGTTTGFATPIVGVMTISVRTVTAEDAEAWAALYRGYRRFYNLPDDAEAVARTWQWVVGSEHGMVGLVATENDLPVGLANLRWFARPSVAAMGLYLDDLFTSPAVRSRGVGRALLNRSAQIAAEGGASVVRWITASDNKTARRLYDAVAQATPWVTYDIPPVRSAPVQVSPLYA